MPRKLCCAHDGDAVSRMRDILHFIVAPDLWTIDVGWAVEAQIRFNAIRLHVRRYLDADAESTRSSDRVQLSIFAPPDFVVDGAQWYTTSTLVQLISSAWLIIWGFQGTSILKVFGSKTARNLRGVTPPIESHRKRN